MSDERFKRILLIVLDSVGIGEMPDAESWGDAGADTLGHVLAARPVYLPNLQRLGLGNVRSLPDLSAVENPRGAFGKCALQSNGKDTTTGHWEIAGIIMEKAFPTYPNGFPAEVIEQTELRSRIVRKISCLGFSGFKFSKWWARRDSNP